MKFLCDLMVIFCTATTPAGDASVRVIDGDGFYLGDREIRIWGIDAPELAQECFDGLGAPYPCGQQAKRALSEIFGDSVPICETVDRDKYGRDVSRCSVDGQDVGAAIVQAGWAVDYTRFSGGAYLSAQDEAQDHRRGLWSGSFSMPWNWRSLSR